MTENRRLTSEQVSALELADHQGGALPGPFLSSSFMGAAYLTMLEGLAHDGLLTGENYALTLLGRDALQKEREYDNGD